MSFSNLYTSFVFVAFFTFLTGCSTSIDEYNDATDEFVLEDFFNGPLKAWGTFSDMNGKVIRRFTVTMTGTWEGNKGVLDEDFVYDDGETQKRIWYIDKRAAGQYSGRADDVIGSAVGQSEGFALNWQYTLRLQTDDGEYDLAFNDWMYMIDPQNVINTAKVTKWGVTVGEVTLFIQKQ